MARRVAEAEPLGNSGPEVVQQRVGAADQLLEDPRPDSALRSRAMLSLPTRNFAFCRPVRLLGSPSSGSTLINRAPISASSVADNGPAT